MLHQKMRGKKDKTSTLIELLALNLLAIVVLVNVTTARSVEPKAGPLRKQYDQIGYWLSKNLPNNRAPSDNLEKAATHFTANKKNFKGKDLKAWQDFLTLAKIKADYKCNQETVKALELNSANYGINHDVYFEPESRMEMILHTLVQDHMNQCEPIYEKKYLSSIASMKPKEVRLLIKLVKFLHREVSPMALVYNPNNYGVNCLVSKFKGDYNAIARAIVDTVASGYKGILPSKVLRLGMQSQDLGQYELVTKFIIDKCRQFKDLAGETLHLAEFDGSTADRYYISEAYGKRADMQYAWITVKSCEQLVKIDPKKLARAVMKHKLEFERDQAEMLEFINLQEQ